jgi:3-polyprenyl-4-hydroxybenzoate decarboxylase
MIFTLITANNTYNGRVILFNNKDIEAIIACVSITINNTIICSSTIN